MGIKIGVVMLLGVAASVVRAFGIALSSFSLFSHTNKAIPARLDHWLRWLLITPDMHRIHHSVRREERDRNYFFHLSWWDRLRSVAAPAPDRPQASLALGRTSSATRHRSASCACCSSRYGRSTDVFA